MVRNTNLMRRNVRRIAKQSVESDEIKAQAAALAVAERKLARLGQRMAQMREKVAERRQALAEARTRRGQERTPETARIVTSAMSKLDAMIRRRNAMLEEYRELKSMVRDQRALCRALEKKEEAKQKAVAKFLKEWERNYDREIRIREKNVRQRKRLTRT